MGIRKFTLSHAHFCMLNNDHSVYRNMALFIRYFWCYLGNYILFLIKSIAQHVFRIKVEDSSQKAMKDYSVTLEPVSEANEIKERDFSGFGEEDEEEEKPSNFSFKFEYQIPKVSAVSKDEPLVSATEEHYQAKSANISNYCFLSEKDFSGFIMDPEAMTFEVHESFIDSSEEKLESTFLSAGDFEKPSVQSEDVMFLKDEKLDLKIPIASETNLLGKKEIIESFFGFISDFAGDFEKLDEKRLIGFEMNSLGEKEVTERFSGFDSDSDSISLSDGYSVKDLVVDSESEGFLSEKDYCDKESLIDPSTFEVELVEEVEKIEEGQSSNSIGGFSNLNGQTNSRNINDGFFSERGFNEPEKILEEKLQGLQSFGAENYSAYPDKLSQSDEIWSENDSLKLELELELELEELNVGESNETQFPSSTCMQIEFMDSSDDVFRCSRNDSNYYYNSKIAYTSTMHENLDLRTDDDSSHGAHLNPLNDSGQADEVIGKDAEGCETRTMEEKSKDTQLKDLGDEDLDELDCLSEHQNLIEQLKMELKRGRAIRLPTIYEESESPKTIEDLKPWKIDEKFLRKDPMDELHKFYKSYRERMRKLDILDQKMYPIGFLQFKDPLESMGTHKHLIPTIISQLSQSLRLSFRRKSSAAQSEKLMKELQIDLETMYVGQTCLSWEFLRWQYEKARELPDSDPYRNHQYNQVAGEFQQFQVIVQRFIENEPFQGPRLQNYVKNRCVLRNLLQVPLIKEDCLKDKMEERRKGNYAITSEMLEDTMEESIRVFWEFVKADKDETSIILKGLLRNQVELQDPSDSELLSEIQASLQKKEKKLKDILKTGNCLVKKFKKPREDRSNQDLFFSQVDMKLVSRVLKMSRVTTDQLMWCHKKLSKITFADRKIHREPSFLLFPC